VITQEQAARMSSLELCERIGAIDQQKADLEIERWRLEHALGELSGGKTYEEFLDGMRRLLAPLEAERPKPRPTGDLPPTVVPIRRGGAA
jgi:hypothetical protein